MDQKSLAVLNQLVVADAYVSVQELAQTFNVSNRKIYNDIAKINDWLKESGYPKVSQVRGQGLYLDEHVKEKLRTQLPVSDYPFYEYSPNERRAWIFIFIAVQEHPLYLNDFIELFQVSRNTILEDIKKLKEEASDFQLNIESGRHHGYQIKGDENELRRVLIHFLTFVTPESGWYQIIVDSAFADKLDQKLLRPYIVFNNYELHLLKNLLIEYERKFQIEFTDEILNQLVVWFYLFSRRIRQEQYVGIDPVEKEVINSTEAFKGAKTLCSNLTREMNMTIPEVEVYYMAKYLLSAKVNYDLNPIYENDEMRSLCHVVEKMVSDFQLYAAVNFSEKEQMIKNLFVHLKPAYYRLRYGIKIENILQNSVEENYPEVFRLTRKVIHHFESLVKQPVTDSEIAYIAMHFGGWLRREGITLSSIRKKLLIVCTSGLGTSRILESQLAGLFSNVDIVGAVSLREYEKQDLAVDFIVSTVPLPDKGIPIFVAKPILDNKDKERLLRKINSLNNEAQTEQLYSVDTLMDMVKRFAMVEDEEALKQELRRYLHSPIAIENEKRKPSLADLLDSEKINTVGQVSDWMEAIKLAALPLLDLEYINMNYVEKMIDNVLKLGPYIVISEQFALPHAAPADGVKKTGMSMLFLEKPVDLMGESVRIFVVLASWDNEQHLKALGQLTKLLKESRKEMLSAKSKEQILKLLESYSNR
ncbi:BglG family transcription antiterminator [Paenibacillus sp. BSR1-1]|uniref:BglG family transcription antiterminator n=1 Tax=Paenibacillus sp. BSR1-1 TaxID=3020845 RepID=UPI0025B061F6|nr:BglG family transcription antiterminator [Paenibacillus sp. BSR1-1]MDN3017945.1 BglG family transcription antiterminator [Paenibacillus sp. BSR1-1]